MREDGLCVCVWEGAAEHGRMAGRARCCVRTQCAAHARQLLDATPALVQVVVRDIINARQPTAAAAARQVGKAHT
jgi:hypothetical protein